MGIVCILLMQCMVQYCIKPAVLVFSCRWREAQQRFPCSKLSYYKCKYVSLCLFLSPLSISLFLSIPDKSGSDLTTSTDPSSSEQSCDTVIYRGPRDDDGTDAESPPVYLPSLNSGDCRAVMSRVLRGSTAELPPAKYRSLDRKQSRSPRLASSAAASPTSSQQSTPVRTLHSAVGGRSGGGSTGSLPRNAGKMPLCGKVAGYRQPAAVNPFPFGMEQPAVGHHNGGQDHHHNHHNHLNHHRLSNAGSGLSSRSRGSDPQGKNKIFPKLAHIYKS